jgi:predicted nucleotidyltransferase
VVTNQIVKKTKKYSKESNIKQNMKLEHYSIEKLKKEILTIVKTYIDLNDYDIFFFGSRVTNKHNPKSDIDLGLLGEKKVPANAYFKIQSQFDKIPLMNKIDLVDFSQTSEDFAVHALKNIDYLNKSGKIQHPIKSIQKCGS